MWRGHKIFSEFKSTILMEINESGASTAAIQ